MRHDPIFMVRVGDLNLTASIKPHQMRFEFTEVDGGGKKLDLNIHNVDLELVDHPAIVTGAEAQFRFGYPENLSPMFKGTLKDVNPAFRPDDMHIQLGIFDAIATLASKEERIVFQAQKDGQTQITESDVVQQIGTAFGYRVLAEPTRHYHSELVQAGTAWDYLRYLATQAKPADPDADVGPYRVVVDHENETIIFKPVNLNTRPKRTFRFYGESKDPSLVSFEIVATTYDPDSNGSKSTVSTGVKPNGDTTSSTADNETFSDRLAQGDVHLVDVVKGEDLSPSPVAPGSPGSGGSGR